MSINLEKTVKDWIDTDPDGDGLTAYLEVPADRPKTARHHRARRRQRESNTAATPPSPCRYGRKADGRPAQLATSQVLPRLLDLDLLDPIAAVSVESVIDFPDPGPPPQPRYQITIQLDAATQ